MVNAMGLTIADLQLDENKDTGQSVMKAMSAKLLAYDEKKSIIASIILNTTDQEIVNRLWTLDAAHYIMQEPQALFYVILHLVRPTRQAQLMEVNMLLNELNSMLPIPGEEIDAFYSKYAKALKTLMVLGHKELAHERGTYFIKSLASCESWRQVLEVEQQVHGEVWFQGTVNATVNVTNDRFSVMGTIITAKIRSSAAFNRWISPTSVNPTTVNFKDDASPQVVWTKAFLEELGHTQKSAVIMQDNKSTIFMAEKGSGNFHRTKHIAVRYFAIKQLIEEEIVRLQYAPTETMLADPLTKPIIGKRFTEWRDQILFSPL